MLVYYKNIKFEYFYCKLKTHDIDERKIECSQLAG